MNNFLQIPAQYTVDKPFTLKTFELGILTNAERKRLKLVTKNIQLLYQIDGEEIPSLITEVYNTQAILVFRVVLQSLSNAIFVTTLLQKAIKPLVIFQCFDESKSVFVLNFAPKRLNKLNPKEIILDGILKSPEMSLSLPNSTTSLFQQHVAYDKILNRANKFEFYFEMYLKALIITHKNVYREYEQLLESKLYYDGKKMKQLEELMLKRIELARHMLSCASLADKAKINSLFKQNHALLDELMEG